jgi:uncharacterized Rmd1/YagE family protein
MVILHQTQASTKILIYLLTTSLYTPYAFTYPASPPQERESERGQTRLPEIFLFDYGVVVFWGMSFKEEQRVIKLLEPFEEEKLGK